MSLQGKFVHGFLPCHLLAFLPVNSDRGQNTPLVHGSTFLESSHLPAHLFFTYTGGFVPLLLTHSLLFPWEKFLLENFIPVPLEHKAFPLTSLFAPAELSIVPLVRRSLWCLLYPEHNK
jgi:hypothetical protein